MPLFVIERHFAEQIDMTRDRASEIERINADVGVQWLFSFLSADRKKSYCLYEAPSAEAIREAALRANVPADVIVNDIEERVPCALGPTQADGALGYEDSIKHSIRRARTAHAEGTSVVQNRHAGGRERDGEVQDRRSVLRTVIDSAGHQQISHRAAAREDLPCGHAKATIHLLGFARRL